MALVRFMASRRLFVVTPAADCLRQWIPRLVQQGVKFIRLLRAPLLVPCPWDEACARLRLIYARS
ncbi:MAG: hypothetical protein EAZ71_10920 [Verrucomicrobia bacterium]|nr:MAG: hypothetical protein EAZ71_10920 [Verrucomicrobiota bacterium]